MEGIYGLIGRLMVRLWWARYRRQIRIAAAIAAALTVAAGYAAVRRVPPEG